jgi:hypothetical protein
VFQVNIGIGLKEGSYTPEAYAYAAYLEKKGWFVQLEKEEKLDNDLDAHIYFMGLRPFFLKGSTKKAVEIHEYQSLSTPNWAKAKNFAKRVVNRRPAARIFLNDIVRDGFGFNDCVPYLLRDMGIDKSLFMEPCGKPAFDLVYCGSINGRSGLIEELLRLAGIGLKLLVAGEVDKDVLSNFSSISNVEFSGRVSREELPEIYRKARAGLNFTPDIYPFNIQTSTKTLEYLAAGLGVVSNRYFWAQNFSLEKNANFLWCEDLISKDVFDRFEFGFADLADLEWGRLLDRSDFVGFLNFIYMGSR